MQIQLNIVSRSFLSDFVAQANLTYKSDTYRSDLQHREDHSQWGKQPKRNHTIFALDMLIDFAMLIDMNADAYVDAADD